MTRVINLLELTRVNQTLMKTLGKAIWSWIVLDWLFLNSIALPSIEPLPCRKLITWLYRLFQRLNFPEVQSPGGNNLKVFFTHKTFLLQSLVCTSYFFSHRVQGGPSGHRTLFVDIKFKLLSQFKLLILKHNSQFEVNKRLFATRRATFYWHCNKYGENVRHLGGA